MSESTESGPGSAIRGGVPVIFPQFNENGPFGCHGFARKSKWTPDLENQMLTLSSNAESLEIWPFEFEMAIGVVLSKSGLEIELKVTNTDSKPFAFQAALHTYFSVLNVADIVVEGLANLEYTNHVTKGIETADAGGIYFGVEVDRTYRNAGAGKVTIREEGRPELLEVTSTNFRDIVVWNPGPDHTIGDLTADGWRNFVCVEAAQVDMGDLLQPGEQWSGSQKIHSKDSA